MTQKATRTVGKGSVLIRCLHSFFPSLHHAVRLELSRAIQPLMNEAILLTLFNLTKLKLKRYKIASSCSLPALNYRAKTALALPSIAVVVPFLLFFIIQWHLLSGPMLNDIVISIQSFMLCTGNERISMSN